MDSTLALLFISFFVMLFLGLPISFSISLASFFSLLTLLPSLEASSVLSQKLMTALDNFGLLAIPFFILAGNIMNQGGIARRLIEFAKVIGGQLPGSLAHCNILANMIFGAISGSAVSAAAAVGGVMTPIQKKEGYDPNFSAAVNIASCPSGLLIPPSGVLILYSLVSGGVSVAALFVAGYIPGILMGLSLMVVAGYIAKKRNYPRSEKISLSQSVYKVLDAIPSLLLIVIVIGGILAGLFTATEASAVAVIYSLALAMFYGEVKLKNLPDVFLHSVVTTSIVLFLVGTSLGMSWVMASANVPELVLSWLSTISDQPLVILLLMNLIFLVVGTFMDLTPAVLIFTPIFLPVAMEIGVHPVHFGIMMVFNLCIGICTPPVGSALFVGCSVADVPVPKVIRFLLPMYVALFLVLIAVTYIPALSLWIPKLMGLI